jgi:hypothetical protein
MLFLAAASIATLSIAEKTAAVRKRTIRHLVCRAIVPRISALPSQRTCRLTASGDRHTGKTTLAHLEHMGTPRP